MIRRRRFGGQDIDRGTTDATLAKGGDEVGFIDEVAASGVDEESAGFHLRESRGVDEVFRLRRERALQGDRGGLGEKLFRGEARDFRAGVGAFATVSHHLHAEGGTDAGDGFSDRAQPDDAEGFPRELADGIIEAGEDGRLRPFLRLGGEAMDVRDEIEEAREDVLGDRLGAVATHVADGETAGAGSLEVDIVHSRGDDLDQFQAGGRVHFLGSDEGLVGQDDFGLAEARAGLLPRARGVADEMAERFDAGEVDVTAVGRGAVEEDESVGHGSGGEMESVLRREEGQDGECRGFRLPRFRGWPSLRSWRRRLRRLRGRG